jgi:hypothetical protein
MIGMPRPGRYRLHGLDSPEAGALLAEQGLGTADLDRAFAGLERSEGIRVRSIVGINHDGVFGSTRKGWRPDLPDACTEPFIPLLWLKIFELLGRCAPGQRCALPRGRAPRPTTLPSAPASPKASREPRSQKSDAQAHAAAASGPTSIRSVLTTVMNSMRMTE